VKAIEDIIGTLQNELLANCKSWTFDDMPIGNVYRKGKNKLVIELGEDAEITVRIKVNGKKAYCHACGKAQAGWPYWWRNVAAGKGLQYGCRECVKASRRDKGQGQGDESES
jgi:hypothetical protein